jgi:hypothetical protein
MSQHTIESCFDNILLDLSGRAELGNEDIITQNIVKELRDFIKGENND